jgi:carbon storage regulator CsrA
MLVLTRHPRQVVMVGSDIQIMVLDVIGGRVRLGITAPCELKVTRLPLPTSPTRSTPPGPPPPA